MFQWVSSVNRVYLHTLSKYRSGRDILTVGAGCNGAPVTQMQARKGTPVPLPGSPATLATQPLNKIPQTSYITTLSHVLSEGMAASTTAGQLTLVALPNDKRLHFLTIAK